MSHCCCIPVGQTVQEHSPLHTEGMNTRFPPRSIQFSMYSFGSEVRIRGHMGRAAQGEGGAGARTLSAPALNAGGRRPPICLPPHVVTCEGSPGNGVCRCRDPFLALKCASTECRRQAEVAALDTELQNRAGLPPEQAAEVEAVAPSSHLLERRATAVAGERAAGLELMRLQSFLVQAQVHRQRLLQLVATIPDGFNR